MERIDVSISQKMIMKEAKEHERLARELGVDPLWLGRKVAEDHARRPKTTTKEGKRLYQRDYMRIVRSSDIPNLSAALGLRMQPSKRRR